METPKVAEIKELDRRRSDNLDVTLWWVKGTLDTYVEVIDYKQTPPRTHNIPVQAPATAHDVFSHPFAYIADMPTMELEAIDGRGAE